MFILQPVVQCLELIVVQFKSTQMLTTFSYYSDGRIVSMQSV